MPKNEPQMHKSCAWTADELVTVDVLVWPVIGAGVKVVMMRVNAKGYCSRFFLY